MIRRYGRMPRERPEHFGGIDQNAALAGGAVLLGLGEHPKSVRFIDSRHYYTLGNHGVLTNMDPATDWVWDSYLGRWTTKYDGVDACVNCGSAANITGAITLAAWIQAAANEEGYVIARGNPWPDVGRYNLYYSGSSETIQWWDGSGSGMNSSAVFTDITWVHALVTMTAAGALAWYRNGVAAGTANATPLVSNTDTTWLGKRHSGTTVGHFFAGQIGDPCIWNRVLSLSEIAQEADRARSVMKGGLILPPRRRIFPAAAAPPAGLSIPIAMHHYKQLMGAA